MRDSILRGQLDRRPQFAVALIQLLRVQMHDAEMKVRLLEIRLLAQCFFERDFGIGKLISLRQNFPRSSRKSARRGASSTARRISASASSPGR